MCKVTAKKLNLVCWFSLKVFLLVIFSVRMLINYVFCCADLSTWHIFSSPRTRILRARHTLLRCNICHYLDAWETNSPEFVTTTCLGITCEECFSPITFPTCFSKNSFCFQFFSDYFCSSPLLLCTIIPGVSWVFPPLFNEGRNARMTNLLQKTLWDVRAWGTIMWEKKSAQVVHSFCNPHNRLLPLQCD